MFNGAVRYAAEELPDDGDLATARTIEVMRGFARADSRDARVRRIARELRRECGNSDLCFADRTHRHVRSRVRFERDSEIAKHLAGVDAEGAEVLIRPADLLSMPRPTGDCDDFSMLAGSILDAGGVPHSFVTVAADRRDPSRFSHVYIAAQTERGRFPIDASHGRTPGWEVRNVFGKRKEWGLSPLNLPMISLGECDADSGLCDAKFTATGYGRASASWWEKLIDGGLNIATRRYGHAPEGTYIQDRDGVYSRGNVPMGVPLGANIPGAAASAAAAFGNIGMGTIALMGVAIIGVALAVSGGGRK